MRKYAVACLVLLAMVGCGGDDAAETAAPPAPGTVRLYTSVTEETVAAVVDGYEAANAGVTVDVFRAPTAELTARIASEQREGGIQADILWLTDPLTMQQYDADGLLLEWEPANAGAVPDDFKSATFWGSRILNMVIVAGDSVDAPSSWSDLTDARLADAVAIPDPGFAGSAFGALAYFAVTDDFGLEYYEALHDNGAVQVQTPADVVTGVAEGQYAAGMTLDQGARDAVAQGSPIVIVWPEPGAIAIYSPIAVVASGANPDAGQSFTDYVLGVEAQQAIAGTGWEPIREDVEWPDAGTQVTIDWSDAFGRQEELLDGYRAIFGG